MGVVFFGCVRATVKLFIMQICILLLGLVQAASDHVASENYVINYALGLD
jgi:hypothetical protein